MKHKTKPCAMCEAVNAMGRALNAKGINPRRVPPCEYCGGSGFVNDSRPRRKEKRRKDMSGEEWTEADSRWEREREYMEREE